MGRFSVSCLSFALAFLLNLNIAAAAGRRTPTLVVSPNPVQSGTIDITRPVAIGSGFQAGKSYSIRVASGEPNPTVMQHMQGSVIADRSGNIRWELKQDDMYGFRNALLTGPTGRVVVTQYSKNGSSTEVASATFDILSNPGSCSVSPTRAAPGTTLQVSGSGAQPNSALQVEWWDQTNCTCWLAGCHSCTWTKRTEPITADSSGAFYGSITPSPANNGYCFHALSIVDSLSGLIVATSSFNICQ